MDERYSNYSATFSATFLLEGVLELVTLAFHFLCWSMFLLISIRITFSTLTRALFNFFLAQVFNLVIGLEGIIINLLSSFFNRSFLLNSFFFSYSLLRSSRSFSYNRWSMCNHISFCRDRDIVPFFLYEYKMGRYKILKMR